MNPLVLRTCRAALDLTQREVATRAGGMSQARYSLIERGEIVPTEPECLALGQVLTLPPDTARVITACLEEVPA